MFKKLLATVAAVFFSGAIAFSANLSLITTPTPAADLQYFLNQLIIAINSGVGGLANAQTGAVSTTATTAETTLQSYTLPASTLATSGQTVRITCWGATAATSNNKTIKLYFGSTSYATPAQASNGQSWWVQLLVMRTAATTQATYGTGVAGTGSLTPVAVVASAGAETLASGVLIKCTGTNGTASASDITANGMIVELVK